MKVGHVYCISGDSSEMAGCALLWRLENNGMAMCKLIRMISVLISFLLERRDKVHKWSVLPHQVLLVVSVTERLHRLGWVAHWPITEARDRTDQGGFLLLFVLRMCVRVCVCCTRALP